MSASQFARCFSLAVVFAGSVTAAESLEYNRDVRPILADACFTCHGPDSAARKGDLRLDQREAALEMGAIVEGVPDESEMIRRILSADPDEVMPPPETKKKLSEAQRETLARWIKAGAAYQLHWSFLTPLRPEVPALDALPRPAGLAGWARNEIDHFIAVKLAEHDLTPAPEADRRTLARRASLDVTGLPPTPAEVARLVNDPTPDAYERYVDRLLDSKHWGEHRGRYWLDYARYADTHGIHFDNYREMWSYRDWVIEAFNENMPFDQFTIENLAGDLLPNRTLAQQIASGFNRCNMTTNEGGIIDDEYQVLYTRDRVDTTAQVWLGLTAGCAVCHSHKFDPLEQREFYELAAFFNNTTQRVRDGNVKDTPPIVKVPRVEDRGRRQDLTGLISQAKQDVALRRQAARSEFDRWLETADGTAIAAAIPTEGIALHARFDEGEGTVAHIAIDGQPREVQLTESTTWQEGITGKALQVQGAATELPAAGEFESDQAFTCTAWVKLAPNDSQGAICARMDEGNQHRGWDLWNQRRQIGMHVIHAWPAQGLKVVAKAQAAADKWVHVAVSYDGSEKAAGVKIYYDGAPQQTNVENDKLDGSIKTDVPFRIGARSSGSPYAGGLFDLRIYGRALSPADVAGLAKATHFQAVLAKQPDQRSDQEKQELYNYWLKAFDEPFLAAAAAAGQLEQELREIDSRGTIAHVMQEKPEPARAHVLVRGEYDQRLEQVAPGTPRVLPPFPDDYPRNRLGFARWLVLPQQPLTARVTVNRFWQEVFGTGIVKTAGDFGVMGQLPSHPALLDWLAIEFRESGWDVKDLFRRMLTSATYRQASMVTPEKLMRDPANRLLSRGPRYRLDAEVVRDYALTASGLLVPNIGGPSVKPYQPPGVWEAIAMNVSNTRSYDRGAGDDLYRRSLYTFIKRMAPPASMDIFNAPNREICIVQRERTNTPLQALVTLNDEQFVEAARHLAQLAISTGGDAFADRLGVLTLRLLAREFRPAEQAVAKASLARLLEYYAAHVDDARLLIAVGESVADPTLDVPTLAAWTMLTNELMNLDEALNK